MRYDLTCMVANSVLVQCWERLVALLASAQAFEISDLFKAWNNIFGLPLRIIRWKEEDYLKALMSFST